MTVKRYDAPKLRAWSDDAQGFCVVESADYDALLALNADLLEALGTARDYVAGELEQRKQALAGYPDKWRTEEQDLAAIDASISKARSQS